MQVSQACSKDYLDINNGSNALQDHGYCSKTNNVKMPDWQTVPANNKRSIKLVYQTQDPQEKKRCAGNNPKDILTIPTTNSFAPLENEKDEMDVKENNSPLSNKDSKPPPIFIPNIKNVRTMVAAIESVISKDDYTFRCSNQDTIKLCPSTIDAYRKLVRHLNELKVQFHTYQLKSEKCYRVVLKNMHYSTDIEDIKNAIEQQNHKVRNIVNARHFQTKLPLSMFFIDLEPEPNNKEIYNLQYLLNAKVVFEPPHKKREIVQCKRCQSYGHTKSYCGHPHRCVKCGKNHDSLTCTKTKEEPPVCALCGGNHPANYKGCTVYADIKKKTFPPLRQRPTVAAHQLEDKNQSQESISQTETPSTSSDPQNIAPARNRMTPSYAQVTSMNKTSNSDENSLCQVIHNFFDKFEKIFSQQAQQIGTLMTLLTTVISKLA